MQLPNLSSFYPKDKKEEKKESSTVVETPEINPDGLKDSAKHVTPVTELKETLQQERKASLPDLPELKKVEKTEPEVKVEDVNVKTDDKKSEKVDFDTFELLDQIISMNASDLHLTVGYPPFYRVDGKLVQRGAFPISSEAMEKILTPILGQRNKEQLEINKEVDFSYAYGKDARFRVNVFNQRGTLAAALRLIPTKIPTLEELHMPKILEDLTTIPQGLVLLVGPTGSGKSTTLASMLSLINTRDAKHIITIEDPIEYVHLAHKSIIDQREVGQDTHSWDIALRSVLRQDPNVVLVGEMRDYETIAAALTVAETGHLVFATLHTNSASQSIDRIIHVFPAEQQAQIRIMLANTITAVVSQRLIPTIGGGRRAAMEVLIGTPAVSNLIREGKEHMIDNTIQTGADVGMFSLESSLVALIREGKITQEEAEAHSTKPEEILRLMRKD